MKHAETSSSRFVLTLSCQDAFGIVAAVSGFLASHDGFIIESAQFGDASTQRFFMRTEFEAGPKAQDREALLAAFTPVAEKFGMEWAINPLGEKPKVLIAVTTASHCLSTLLNRQESGSLAIKIPAIISNRDTLRHMATRHGIPFYHLPIEGDKAAQEEQLLNVFEQTHADVLVLARYMQVLSPELCEKLKGRAINIHHSFLPGFKGANPYQQAYDRGVKIIGATAHYVTENLDEGPIIEQEVIRVSHHHQPNDLKQMGQDIESQVLARAVKYHIQHRVLVNGSKTVVFT